jgi:hypothetical protein
MTVMPTSDCAAAAPSPSRRPSAAFALSGIVLALVAGCGGGGGSLPKPPISLASEPALAGTPVRFQVTLPEGFTGPASLQVDTVELGTHTLDPADGFARAGGSCGEAGADFVAIAKGTLQVAAGSRTGAIDVTTCANTAVEANERFAVDVLWDGKPYRLEGLIVNNAAGGLNDTGITSCLNAAGALTDCASAGLPGQDGATGRDARALTATTTVAAADGRLGFSYSRDAAGCVTDNVTGLTWAPSAQATATWSDASTLAGAANTAHQCGYTDWRVPTTQELLSLVDAGAAAAPLIDAGFFGGTPAANHWTVDALSTDSSQAWYVSFGAGLSAFDNQLNPFAKAFYTRLVRGTAVPSECDSDSAQRYVDHGNGTVTDTRTGLMWQRCADGQSGTDCGTGAATAHASFAAALSRVAAVNADVAGAGRGHDDWRVPNRNELASLVQAACAAPAINRLSFPATPTIAPFWSSSPAGASLAWVVQFNDGQVLPAGINGNRHLRLVRAGQ